MTRGNRGRLHLRVEPGTVWINRQSGCKVLVNSIVPQPLYLWGRVCYTRGDGKTVETERRIFVNGYKPKEPHWVEIGR